MTIFPVRDVAKFGVITDQDPYDLPTEAWSLGVNVRFQNRKVTRGPVWRAVQQPLSESSPRFVCGNTFNTGQDFLFIGYLTGDVKQYQNGTETLFNPSTYVTSSAEATWTYTTLAGVLWINRADRAPWFLRAGDSAFSNFTLATTAATASGAVLTFGGGVPSWVAVGMSVLDLTTTGAITGGQTVQSVTSTTVTLAGL
jgi:hypothetical protein